MRKVDTTALYDMDLNHWVRKVEEIFMVGLSDFGQKFIGEVSNISELPKIGQILELGAMYGVLESDKAANEIHLPIGGKVVAINEQLFQTPHLINEDCYGEGWIIKLTAVNPQELAALQSAEMYATAVGSFFNK